GDVEEDGLLGGRRLAFAWRAHAATIAPASPGNRPDPAPARLFHRLSADLSVPAGKPDDDFGISVALDADGATAVVGANLATISGAKYQGTAYVYTRSGSAWSYSTQLTAFDGAADERFGGITAIGGWTIVVGVPLASLGSNFHQGAAYVFASPLGFAVTADPVSQTAYPTTTTTFTAAATGAETLSTQWQASIDGGATWSNIDGATNSWYTLTPALTGSGDLYRSLFTNESDVTIATNSAMLTVVKAPIIVSAASSANPRRIGDPLTITVDVASAVPGAGVPQGGTLTLLVGFNTIKLNMSATLIGGRAEFAIPELAPGDYRIEVIYDGTDDPIFNSYAWELQFIQVVVRGISTLTAEIPTASASGQAAALTAVVGSSGAASTPTGGVIFLDNGQPIRFVQVSQSEGRVTAAFTTSTLAVGDHYFQLVYLGDPRTSASASGVYHMVVKRAGSPVQANPARVLESAVTEPARVMASPAVGAAPVTTNGVAPARAATVGSIVTLTASTAGPNVSAQWQVSTDGGESWMNVVGANQTWYTVIAALADSGKLYRAELSEAGRETAYSDPVTLDVRKKSTLLTIVPTASRSIGGFLHIPLRFASLIPGSGTPKGGTVRLTIGSVSLEAANVEGDSIVFPIPAVLAPGVYTATATYDDLGDPLFGPATATMTQFVVRASSVLGAEILPRATFGQEVTLSAYLVSFEAVSSPTGGVMILDNGQPIQFVQVREDADSYLMDASIVFTTSSFSVGDHYFQLVYLGDPQTYASASGVSHLHVDPAPIAVTLDPLTTDQAYYGRDAQFRVQALVGDKPVSSLAGLMIDGVITNPASALDATGARVFTVPNLSVGAHTVTTWVDGSDVHRSGLATITYTVSKAVPLVTLTSSRSPSVYGASLTFTATVFADGMIHPSSGTVRFYVGREIVAHVPVDGDGKATLTTSALVPGVYMLTAYYMGSANFKESVPVSIDQTITPPVARAAAMTTPPAATISAERRSSTMRAAVPGPLADRFTNRRPLQRLAAVRRWR
ncbi:MAG: Ig-like domain repeat protein, partial [Paludisphaera borealis]|uniref:Ig-like domain repeat protein n=1 Tax=Paludisphaera borealis TaxID=1387353 RepID=UPI00283D095B